MNRFSSRFLLVGTAAAVAWLCIRPSTPTGTVDSPTEEEASIPIGASPASPRSFAPLNLAPSALAKLDPILVEMLEDYRASKDSVEPRLRWNAMVVLNIPHHIQDALANVFDQKLEASPAHLHHDDSSGRSKTEGALEIAYAKRKWALEEQADILEDCSDSFLANHPGLAKRDIRSRLRLAPMISINASPEVIVELAESNAVRHIGADSPAEKSIERAASEARFPHAWNSDFFDGTGVKVALLEEYDVPYSHLVGPGKPIKSPVAIYDPDNVSDHEHSSNTAAVLWGQDSFFRGLALGSNPYFATAETTTGRVAATDWCIQQGVSIISMSWGSPAENNDGNLKWFDLYYDWVTEINRVLIVAAAGNDGNDAGRVIHPGAAFNVLTVGALDGRDPNTWSDDTVANYSSYADPNTGTMKPEVVSYGTNIKAAGVAPAFSTVSSGTSYATPAVAAAAALCIQENPDSADEPMLLKAQLMASGIAHDFAGTDRDGVGTVLAQAYNAATSARTVHRTGTTNLEWDITLDGGRTNRIVLCYPHRPNSAGAPNSGTSVDNHNSYHEIDLDLELWVDGVRVAQSDFGINNPFEVIDYTPTSSTPATVRIVNFDWKSSDPRDSVRVGLAHGSTLNFGSGPDDSNDDHFEPNDSDAEASTLSLDANLTDLRSTDEDWFLLEIPPHTNTNVRIDFEDPIGNLHLAAHRTDSGSVHELSITDNHFEEVDLPPSVDAKTWRVRVFPQSSVIDRTSYSLRVQSDLPLRQPTPVSPTNGATTSHTPTLSCSLSSPEPKDSNPRPHGSTRWQISESPSFASLLVDETISAETAYQVANGALSAGGQYFWRVRHIDADNRPGPWSGAASFGTASPTGFPGSTLNGLEQEWLGNDLEITWDPVPDADGYRLYKGGTSSAPRGTLFMETNETTILLQDLIAGERSTYWITATQNDSENQGRALTVAAPAAKVDGLIGLKANRLRGNDRYSNNGSGQKVRVSLSNTGRGTLFFAGENESLIQSHLLFRSIYSKRHLKTRIKTVGASPQNVSAELAASGYPAFKVPSRGFALFKARIITKRRDGPRQNRLRIVQSATSNARVPLFSDTTLSVLRRR